MKNDQEFSRIDVKRLTFTQNHCAFTDLVCLKNKLYCCFRSASNHVSGDGIIWIYCLTSNGKLLHKTRIAIDNADLRDPKLCISPENQLMLLAYARYADENNKTFHTENITWFSQSGDTWSAPVSLGMQFWWLWRLRYSCSSKSNHAFGLAYNRSANRVDFYSGDPRRYMQCKKVGALSLAKHGLGYPNESDMIVHHDNSIHAIVRRDADSFTAQLGYTAAPHQKWQWRDLREYIGGPVTLSLNNKNCLVAGRAWTGKSLVTRLWRLNLVSAKLEVLDTLPSAGDNSYPGLAMLSDRLFLSYYSSHQDNKSQIYLAQYKLTNKS